VGDIRSLADWNQGHIQGATHLPPGSLPQKLRGCETCTIAIYCTNPYAAQSALMRLRSAGFKGMLFNAGGFNTWASAGYPVSKTSPSVTPPCATGGKCTGIVFVPRQPTPVFPPPRPVVQPAARPVAKPVARPVAAGSAQSPISRPTINIQVQPVRKIPPRPPLPYRRRRERRARRRQRLARA